MFILSAVNQVSVAIEHSENKIIMQFGLFENEIRPGVLWSSIQQTRVLQDFQWSKVFATKYVLILSFLWEFLQSVCLLNGGLDNSSLIFKTA